MLIKYSDPHSNISYVGRNGTGYCKGLAIVRTDYVSHGSSITVQPINSKDRGANCFIDIPVEDVVRVANAMTKLAGQTCLMGQIRKALGHALQRLNEIPHRYADTHFSLIEDALLEVVLQIGPDEFTPSHLIDKALDIASNVRKDENA